METPTHLISFMGFNLPQTIECHHNDYFVEEVTIYGKWILPESSYEIGELIRMENDDEIICNFDGYEYDPFYCWDEAMKVIHKIELTPCNESFPIVTLSSKHISIEVDGKTIISQIDYSENNKLSILEFVVEQFLEYYYSEVKID